VILWYDTLFVLLPYRAVLAYCVLRLNYARFYKWYYKVRLYSFFAQTILILAAFFYWVYLDVYEGQIEFWFE
jgi:hypothetical protein